MAPKTDHERHVERFLAFLLMAPVTSQRGRFFDVVDDQARRRDVTLTPEELAEELEVFARGMRFLGTWKALAVLVATPLVAWLVARAAGTSAAAGAAAIGFGVAAILLRARIARNRVLFEQIRERIYAPYQAP